IGPKFIGARTIWKGNNPFGLPGTKGEGAVIAVLDSGINSDHPSFAEVGGDGYKHTNPLGDRNYIPGSYCAVVNPLFCNAKLIGAWDMVNDPDDDPGAPQDSDGHGSHTASTAGGNVIKSATLFAPTTQLSRNISGVAPHANIIAYDVCVDGCPTSAILAAQEQVIIDAAALPDGIHALNYSISGGNDPYNDPIELAFLNLTEAGVFVSTSAGNNGPGPSTTGHNSPWVTNVAAMTHTRRIDNSVTGLTSDGAPLGDLLGAGLTAGFGPAPIVYAGDFPTANGSSNDTDPAQCLEPFPAGHFNGEIVVCDRGTIARVAKGANVLAGSAGGFVLANAEANGEAVVADAHVLPGVHLGFSKGETLKSWIAGEANNMATIAGFSLNIDKANADVMADFSSRGPNLAIDILKPDVGAPGVSIFAAEATDGVTLPPEYQFLSGTSMSSPHNAGSGALVSLLTGWSPYEIKSALMMTAKRNNNFKEDGVTPTDPFDVGGGRIDLKKVLRSGLVLGETGFNFLKADPNDDGDPKTLNIASMQDSNCVGECSWERTVTNKSGKRGTWRVVTRKKTGGLKLTASPSEINLRNGRSAKIRVSADNTLASAGWNFGELQLRPENDDLVNLHMPVAVQTALSSSPNLTKTVDKDTAVEGDVLTYTIDLANGQLDGTINLSDVVPEGLIADAASASETVTNGSTTKPFGFVSATEATWSGTLDVGGLELTNSGAPSPAGFLPLELFGVAPFGCPANCDDGATILNVPSFVYNGQTYSDVIWSVNGTLEAGSVSGLATAAGNQNLPNATPPNNIIAPLWTDLNLGVDGDGAEWYVAVLTDGPDQYTVYEWNNIPLFGAEDVEDPNTRFSFQIWVQNGPSGNIWLTYGPMGNVSDLSATVGVENEDG
ncbi:MAG: S8 family serine peptidase, partial [Pseudomonadales bacterium]